MKDNLNCLVSDSIELSATASGPLDGKTFVVKDCIAIADHTSSFGHPAWQATHDKSDKTAAVVEKLLIAGANMAGLAKLDQLTYSLTGNISEDEPPLNSLYPDRFTGGSSSGSASAVAGELVNFAVGTDTGGSVRIPSSACGLYGIRPTYGRIDSTGVLPLASTFDTIGLFAKDPVLLRDVFKVVATDPEKQATKITHLLIAVDSLAIVDPEVAEVVRQTAERLGKALGIKVEELKSEALFGPAVSELFVRLQAREIWAAHAQWMTEHLHELAPGVQDRLQNLCMKYANSPESEKRADLEARQKYRQQFDALVTPGTIIVKPVTPSLPPERKYGQNEPPVFRQKSFRLTAPAGAAGAPEVVIPVKTKCGLTFGVGLLGARGEDMALLQAALKARGQD